MELIHTLEEHGYETGKLKSKMDLRQAEALLVKSYPEILWVGIHYEGTKMVVRISESVIPPEIMPTEDTPTAICAKRDALITAITVEKGKPMVKVGDIVEKGELLVNGEMPLGEEQPTLYYTSAKAAIRGKTIYVAKDEITLLQKRRSYTQQTSKRYRLNFFDKKITLYAQKNLQGEYDTQYTRHQLYVTKLFPLPFGVETETQFGYLPVYKTLTEEEAKDELLSCLWKKVKGQLSRDAIVLKREATFRSSEGKMIGILYITAEENIGYEVGIQQQMLNKGEVTNEQN